MRTLAVAALLLASACTTTRSDAGWTGTNAQPFDTAYSACLQISAGVEDYFLSCMAGRGWSKKKKD